MSYYVISVFAARLVRIRHPGVSRASKIPTKDRLLCEVSGCSRVSKINRRGADLSEDPTGSKSLKILLQGKVLSGGRNVTRPSPSELLHVIRLAENRELLWLMGVKLSAGIS